MNQQFSKYIQIGEWCFEIKTMRALKVDQYGQPYSAIANCNINGDTMYVDGLMTNDGELFSKEDFKTFERLCAQLNLTSMNYHRYKRGVSQVVEVPIIEPDEPSSSSEPSADNEQSSN